MPFVKPNPEKKLEDGTPVNVFDNVRKDFLPEDGRMVPANAYWNRMLQRGDVVTVEQPEPEPVADFPLYNEAGEPVDEDGTVLMKVYMSDGTQVWVSKEEQFTPEEIEHLKQHPELVATEKETLKAVKEAEANEPAKAEPATDTPPKEPPAEADTPQEPAPSEADAETKTVAKTAKKSAAKSKTKTE